MLEELAKVEQFVDNLQELVGNDALSQTWKNVKLSLIPTSALYKFILPHMKRMNG